MLAKFWFCSCFVTYRFDLKSVSSSESGLARIDLALQDFLFVLDPVANWEKAPKGPQLGGKVISC